MNPNNLKYTKEHEWILVEGNQARIGITEYAQNALGDVVFVELPETGEKLELGGTLGVVESVKAVSDIYTPCTGVVKAINERLLDSPELVNQAPYEAGWMVEVEVEELAPDLLTAAEYEKFIAEEEK